MPTLLPALAVVLLAATSAEVEAPPERLAPESLPALLEIEGRVSLSPTWDSNATRTTVPEEVVSDGASVLLGSVDFTLRPSRTQRLSLALDEGGKLFLAQSSQDQLVSSASLEHSFRLGRTLAPVTELQVKDKTLRGGDRDYTELSGTFGADLGPFGGFSPGLHAGWRLFRYKPDDRFSSRGPFAQLSLRAQPMKRHLLSGGYELSYRAFPQGAALDRAGAEQGRRYDLLQLGQVGWSYRSKLILGAGYAYSRVASNGFGLSSVRHRVSALAGTKLPFELLVNVQVAYQDLRFPDGVFISPEILLVDDDENLSSVQAKLTRPLGESFALEARYQLFSSSFARTDVQFFRQVAGVGLAYRF